MVKQYRFTVYTQDSQVIRQNPNEKKREFSWKLNMGQIVEPNANVKMAIESIHCRDMSQLLQNANAVVQDRDVDGVRTNNNGGFRNTQIATALGNADEKELYSIRCRNVNSRYFWDSRANKYDGGSLIYNGSLNFQNTNPATSFCFPVDGDIANSEFVLCIDDNFLGNGAGGIVDQVRIKASLQVAVTFILFIDSDDDKK